MSAYDLKKLEMSIGHQMLMCSHTVLISVDIFSCYTGRLAISGLPMSNLETQHYSCQDYINQETIQKRLFPPKLTLY